MNIVIAPAYARHVWYYTTTNVIKASENMVKVPLFEVKDAQKDTAQEVDHKTPVAICFPRIGRYKLASCFYLRLGKTDISDVKITRFDYGMIGDSRVSRLNFSWETGQSSCKVCTENAICFAPNSQISLEIQATHDIDCLIVIVEYLDGS